MPEQNDRNVSEPALDFQSGGEIEGGAQNDREKLRLAVRKVLWNASNYPDRVQPHLLGQDITSLTTKVVEAVATLAAPPVVDEAKVTMVLLNAETALDDLPYPATVATHLARYLVEHRDEWLGGTR